MSGRIIVSRHTMVGSNSLSISPIKIMRQNNSGHKLKTLNNKQSKGPNSISNETQCYTHSGSRQKEDCDTFKAIKGNDETLK